MSDLVPTAVVETSSIVPNADISRLHAKFEKHLRSGDNEFLVDVDFEVPSGFTILFGSSGAGKTTVLDCLAGLTTPDAGRITIGDRVLFDSSLRVSVSTAKLRAGYVFQTLALFPHMTVEQNVAYGLAHLPHSELSDRVKSLLDAFRISHLAKRKARSISGGESQRVALARTLVTDPQFLLLDEPLAARNRDRPRPHSGSGHSPRGVKRSVSGNRSSVGRIREHLHGGSRIHSTRARHHDLPDSR